MLKILKTKKKEINIFKWNAISKYVRAYKVFVFVTCTFKINITMNECH